MNASAGLLDLFSTKVSADIVDSLSSTETSKNSQNMDLLQADVSVVLAMGGNEDTEETEYDYTNIMSDNALIPDTNPMGTGGGAEVGDPYSDQISVYVVRTGDSISQIAEMFDITVDTILSANDMQKGDKLKEGDVLLILPFSGVEHTVVKGETLQGIAKAYNVEVSKITVFNVDLDKDSKLAIGEKLIIPGAGMLSERKIIPNTGKSNFNPSYGALQSIPGYFIRPLPTGPGIRNTQGIHDRYAIDVGAPVGTPIYAAAAGTVTFARGGWNGGYGTVVFIKHSKGLETRYAHMSRLNTSSGKQVSQGEVIGYVGSTGRSTGSHLHYEVRGAWNNLLVK